MSGDERATPFSPLILIPAGALTLASLVWSWMIAMGQGMLSNGTPQPRDVILQFALDAVAPAAIAGVIGALLPLSRRSKWILAIPPLIPALLAALMILRFPQAPV